MKKLLLTLVLLFSQLNAVACVVSPFATTIHNADKLMVSSDIFFFGRFDSAFTDDEKREQVAKFTVIKSYKGNVSGEVVIENNLTTSCSRLFESPMSAYYVFAKLVKGSGNYRVEGGATFIPLEYSLEENWAPEL